MPDWASTREFRDALILLLILAAFITMVILSIMREGRNKFLEQMLTDRDFGPPEKFSGSLIVEDHRPGINLKSGRNPAEARGLQRAYRWLMGFGRRARYDAATFDRSSRTIELKKSKGHETVRFEEFLAVRMKEVPLGKSLMSIWLVELVLPKAKPIPIIDSPHGDRRVAFEHTAPLLKAISAATDLPMQVWVLGKVWTPDWPPKVPSASA